MTLHVGVIGGLAVQVVVYDTIGRRAFHAGTRPGGANSLQVGRTLSQAVGPARIGATLGDAEFNAEWKRRSFRPHGFRSVIAPECGRANDNPQTGSWRS